jgi:hypothetical protein
MLATAIIPSITTLNKKEVCCFAHAATREGMRDKRIQNKVWLKIGTLIALLLLISQMTACTFTQTTFARTANNVGSAFAAAEATLTYAHTGKITFSYAASSFVNFQSELSGIDQTLSAQGIGNTQLLHQLLYLYAQAMRVVEAPCLSNVCDWRGQIEILNRASQAFLNAGNS